MQGFREKFSDFVLELIKMNCMLNNRFSEQEMLSCLFDNMYSALRNVTLAGSTICTIEGLRAFCQGIEKLWDQTGHNPRKLFDSQFRRPNMVNEIDDDSGNVTSSIPLPSLNVQNQESQNIRAQDPQTISTQNSPSQSDMFHTTYIDMTSTDGKYSLAAFQPNISVNRSNSDYLICWSCHDLVHRYQFSS